MYMYLISKLHAEYMLQSQMVQQVACINLVIPVILFRYFWNFSWGRLKIYISATQENAVPTLNQPGIEPGLGANHLMVASACDPTTPLNPLSDIPYSIKWFIFFD